MPRGPDDDVPLAAEGARRTRKQLRPALKAAGSDKRVQLQLEQQRLLARVEAQRGRPPLARGRDSRVEWQDDGQLKVVQYLPGGWEAAFTIVPQDGDPVIGELTIRHSSARTPQGGLPARTAKLAQPGDALKDARNIIELKSEKAEGSGLVAVGFRRKPRKVATVREPLSGPGRPRTPDAVFAEVAFEYARLLREEQSDRPTQDLAERRFDGNVKRAQAALTRARKLGLLTDAPSPGRAGGVPTARAMSLLGLTMEAAGQRATARKGKR